MIAKTRTIQMALWALVALALIAALWFGVLAPQLAPVGPGTIGRGDYRLVASDGTAFTEETLQGTPSAVFFGFTHCPDVCPTTLGDIARWQKALGEEGPIRAFFVTVDPERDTREVLADYISWAPGVTGVTGSPSEIEKAVEAFRIYASKVPLDEGGYTMEHSAMVLLFDENGRFFESIGYHEDFDRAVDKIRRLMAG